MASRQSDGTVIKIETKEEFDKLLVEAGDQLLVVDFYADWCGPCRAMSPKVVVLAKENMTVLFAKVNVDEVPDVSEECKISAMPTFQFYKKGVKVYEFQGASEAKLREGIEKYR